jgi:hypothetical protein
MRHFWQGFQKKTGAPVQFKKHVIMVFCEPEDRESDSIKSSVKRFSSKYPSVKVKIINIKKDATKPMRHMIIKSPTILLLKDGREVERVSKNSDTLLEELFRRAHV